MKRRQTVEGIVTIGLILVAWPLLAFSAMPYARSLAVLILIYYLLASSLNAVMGYTDLISFGQAAFFGIGAYAAVLSATYLGVGLLGGALIGIAISSVLALIVSSVSRALSGVYFALATMAAAEIVHIIILNWVDLTRGPLGLSLRGADRVLVPGVRITPDGLFHLIVVVAVVVTIAFVWFVRSDVGVRTIGVRENADLAASIGVVPARQRTIAFLVSGAIAAIGGALYAFSYGILTPSVAGLHYSALALLIVIFGGRGTILGPLIGAMVFVLLPESIGLEGALGEVAFAVVLLVVVLLLPNGIVGSIGDRTGGLLRRLRRARSHELVAEGER